MNRLSTETSPYLLQHAHNPVQWYPWGEAALAKAKAEDKPIFLSIGYAACHWCHVMAHESFENAAIAAVMNENFVNVKVDREERPDLDSIYMDAVVSLTGHGGWPMSVFLTPDGTPFYGGTYFPPVARGGMPAFADVLRGVRQAWDGRREAVLKGGKEVLDYARQGGPAFASGGAGEALTVETLNEAAQAVFQQFDWRLAGWGQGPKFPQPMTLEFLLRRHALAADPLALEMAVKTLDAMLNGGMYDQLGGGFHRYATDASWLVPHFEKMLYDNSQLARVYLHAWQVTGNLRYRRCAEEVLDYVQREMTDGSTALTTGSGGFYSTQDADSEGVEGKFFVWDEAEIDSILGELESRSDDFSRPATEVATTSELFKSAYGVTARGNFEHKSILFAAADIDTLAQKFDLTPPEVERKLAAARRALFEAREKRVHPALDDKVLSGWNGLMLAAFAEAAQTLGRDDYRATAVANAEFILREMRTAEGRLYRSWRKGRPKLNGYLEDYGAVIEGLLALYETTFEDRWFTAARDLADSMLAHFADPQGGFFDTSDDHEALVTRPKSLQDNAVPSGNALAATVLLKLGAFTGEGRYTDVAEAMLRTLQPVLGKHPTAFGQWLVALTFALGEPKEVAIAGDPAASDTQAMLAVVRRAYRPFQVLAVGHAGSAVPLLAGRTKTNGQATAYVCFHFACRQPTTEATELGEVLDKTEPDRQARIAPPR